MSRKVVIIADPGIDTSFAIGLALLDPQIDLVGLIATAGNVRAEQATINVHVLIDQFDPPKWPRIGAALPIDYEIDGMALHGPNGFGGIEFPSAIPHQQWLGDKLLVELVRTHPGELSILVLGPCTVLARALDVMPELPRQVQQIIIMGGSRHEPGNAGPTAEFHFACDPLAARQVLHAGGDLTVLPLDATRKLVFSPTDLLESPDDPSKIQPFLRQIIPFGIRATSNLYGVEGFHLKDVLGVIALAHPGLLSLRELHVDIETRGELTRGMSVVDDRAVPTGPPNCWWGVGVDLDGVRDYIDRLLNHPPI